MSTSKKFILGTLFVVATSALITVPSLAVEVKSHASATAVQAPRVPTVHAPTVHAPTVHTPSISVTHTTSPNFHPAHPSAHGEPSSGSGTPTPAETKPVTTGSNGGMTTPGPGAGQDCTERGLCNSNSSADDAPTITYEDCVGDGIKVPMTCTATRP